MKLFFPFEVNLYNDKDGINTSNYHITNDVNGNKIYVMMKEYEQIVSFPISETEKYLKPSLQICYQSILDQVLKDCADLLVSINTLVDFTNKKKYKKSSQFLGVNTRAELKQYCSEYHPNHIIVSKKELYKSLTNNKYYGKRNRIFGTRVHVFKHYDTTLELWKSRLQIKGNQEYNNLAIVLWLDKKNNPFKMFVPKNYQITSYHNENHRHRRHEIHMTIRCGMTCLDNTKVQLIKI